MKKRLVSSRLVTTTLLTALCCLVLLCFGSYGFAEPTPFDSGTTLVDPAAMSSSAMVDGEVPSAPGVDTFSGALRESIPISVPPGRNGMEPKLSLTYASSNPNGWLGMGWELGMGTIERDSRFGIDYAGDSYVMRRQGGAMQLLAVNGEYRARIEQEFARIQKKTAGDGQPYWEVTDKSGVRYYYGRTAASRQVDPANAGRIFKWCLDRIEDPNGNYLTVSYSKHQGQIYLDRIDYTGNVNGSLPSTNYMKFYLEDRTDAPISYATGFAVTTAKRLKTIDLVAGVNRVRTYVLAYDTDPNTGGVQYSTSTGQSVLTSAQQFGSDATVDSSGTITNAATASRLPAVELGYSKGPDGFEKPFVMIPTEQSAYWAGFTTSTRQAFQFTGDFNGDGRTDFMYWGTNGWTVLLNNGHGFDPPTVWAPYNDPNYKATYWLGYASNSSQSFHFTGDFNGDGKTDFMYWGANGWMVLLSNGHGFERPTEWAPYSDPNYKATYWLGYASNSRQSFHFTGDFNGDGKTDFMYWGANGWMVILSNGHGFERPTEWAPYSDPNYKATYWLGYASNSNQSFHFTGDYNGDGKTDFMYWGANGWMVLLSNGHGFDPPTVWAPYSDPNYQATYWLGNLGASSQSFHFTGDFNGDGKTDFMYWASSSGANGWMVLLSNGHGFERPTLWAPYSDPNYRATYWVYFTSNSNQSYHLTGDYNGDGKTDFMYWGANGWSILLSSGNNFFPPKLWAPYSDLEYRATYWEGNLGPSSQSFQFPGDFNGDGKTDFMYWAINKGWTILTANNGPADLLNTMSNGLGSRTDIAYTPSTSYDNLQLPFPLQTVKSVTVCDSYDKTAGTCLGNAATTSYAYAGGYLNIAERDFRGFRYAKTTGPAGAGGEQSVTETWYHQGDETGPVVDTATDADLKALASAAAGATKGKPYRTRVSDSQGNLYRETVATYAPNSLTPNYFTPLARQDALLYDGGPTARQTRTDYLYDSYGNPVREERYNDVDDATDDLTVVRSYAPNTGNWIVGLPATEDIYAGIGTAGVKVAGKSFYYDDLTDCNGAATGNQTPVKGNLTRVKSLLDGVNDPESRLAYDDYGNRVCSRDANLNTTTVTFDATATFPLLTVNSLGHRTVTSYYTGGTGDKGLYGQVKSVTDPNNVTTALEYDTFGRKTKEILPDSTTTTISYNSFGTVGSQNVKTVSSLGPWSESYFDGLGRTFKTRKSGPGTKVVVSETRYDARGALDRASLPYFETLETPQYATYTYDPMGRATSVAAPDGARTLTCYDKGVAVSIDPNNHRKRTTKDSQGRLVQVDEYTGAFTACTTDPGTPYATTTYQYDPLGNLRFLTDAEGNRTEMRYDLLGRKSFMHDPDMGDWSYGYDANGNLTSQTDAKQQLITFSYDALQRVTRKHYPSGIDVVYKYDEQFSTYPLGRLTTMTDESGSTTYFYDKLGRANRTVTTVGGGSYAVASEYDGLGRVKSITYPDNETVSYSYNSDGSLATVGGYLTFAGYNAFGKPGSLTYGNGVATTNQYYPDNGRLYSITTNGPTQGLLNISYSYDTKGNVARITDHLGGGRDQNFFYDELDRLTAAQGSYGSKSYSYSPIGNILTKEGVAYTYGTRPHAVAALSSGKTFSYDANGNMTADTQRTIDYTFDNMPRSINGSVNFMYNGAGNRAMKSSPTATTVYIGKLYECTNGYCDKHIYAGSSRIALKTATRTFYHHTDHLGSSTVVTDDTGASVETLAYYPFGGTQTDNKSVYLNYKYTGQELDSETGLYNYNARLYDPELGRFVTADTIVPDPANPQSLNRYSYVLNNPLFYTDPTGHDFWSDLVDAVINGFEEKKRNDESKITQSDNSNSMILRMQSNSSTTEDTWKKYLPTFSAYIGGPWSPSSSVGGGGSVDVDSGSSSKALSALGNPFVNNTLSLVGGGLQAFAGYTIATITAPTVVGPIVGGFIAAQGVASASTSAGNLFNLAAGAQPLVNNSGLVGLSTSIFTMGTSSKSANNLATATDMGLNLLAGGIGNSAANAAIFAKSNALTANYSVLNTTHGVTGWIPKLKNTGRFANSVDLLGAYSNLGSAYR